MYGYRRSINVTPPIECTQVSLSKYKGKYVILMFYPLVSQNKSDPCRCTPSPAC